MSAGINSDAAYIPGVNMTDQVADPPEPALGHTLVYTEGGILKVYTHGGDPAAVGATPALTENLLAVGSSTNTLANLAPGATGAVPTRQADGTIAEVVPTGGGGGGGASLIFLPPFLYSAIGAGSVNVVNTVGPLGGWVYLLSSPSNGNHIDWQADMVAGTYSFRLLGATSNTHAIISVRIDGTEVYTFDAYSGSTVWNTDHTGTGIVVASSGLKTISVVANGHNASSSGYDVVWIQMGFWRTA